jgi:hypothetical protein
MLGDRRNILMKQAITFPEVSHVTNVYSHGVVSWVLREGESKSDSRLTTW